MQNLKNKILEDIKEYYKLSVLDKPFVPGETYLNYGGAMCNEQEFVGLFDQALGFWLTAGKYTNLFEEKLANYLDAYKVLSVNSGSSANLLAFSILTSYKLGHRKIRRGDEIITVAAGFPTTISPALQYGAVPVFVDVDIDTMNINLNAMKEALTIRTKAVIVAHTLGNVFNIDEVVKFCKDNNLWLIEDNCDALGSTWNNKKTGTFGDLGTQSFYPPHHITTGEGGAVIVNNPDLYAIALSMRNWGRDCVCDCGKDNKCGKRHSRQDGKLPFGYDHKYVASHLGYNLKFTDLQAAVGCAQIDKLPGFVQDRRQNWAYLYAKLKHLPIIFQKQLDNASASWFGFSMITRSLEERNKLINWLESNKIATRMLFMGNILKQPCFTDDPELEYRICGDFKNTDIIMNQQLWIGVYSRFNTEKLDYMIAKIKEFYARSN